VPVTDEPDDRSATLGRSGGRALGSAPGPVSVNTVVLDALTSKIERVKKDKQFIARLRDLTERDKEILDRLAR